MVVVTTCRRFKAAVRGEQESHADLLQYTANSHPDELEEWKAMSRQCQENQLTNPHAMNIYDIDPGQAEVTQSTLQLDLLQVEGETSAGKGKTSWLALSLKLQEAQCVSLPADLYYLTFHRLALRTFIHQKGSMLMVAKRVQIATKWQNLDIRLDSFRA